MTTKKKATTPSGRYRVVRGLSWGDGQRAEPGEIRDDIPEKSVKWLVEQGHIEPVKE